MSTDKEFPFQLTSGEHRGRPFVSGNVIFVAGTACTPNRISDSRIRLGAIVTQQKRGRITGGDECRQESGHILPFRLVVVVIEILTWHWRRHRHHQSHAVVLATTNHWGRRGRRWWSFVIEIHYIYFPCTVCVDEFAASVSECLSGTVQNCLLLSLWNGPSVVVTGWKYFFL